MKIPNTKYKTPLLATFYLEIFCLLVILCSFFVDGFVEAIQPIFLLVLILFSLLGILLIIFTFKAGVKNRLKKFLLLTGFSSGCFFLFVILHNAFYAAAEISSTAYTTANSILPLQSDLYTPIFQGLEVVFFLIAVIGCPLGFFVGAIGSLLILYKD